MLLRFDPFRELDRVAEQVTQASNPTVPFDAVRVEDRVIASFDLPGVDPASIDLEVDRNVLTLKAERRPRTVEGQQVLARERRHGSFSRQLFLGDSLDGQRIEANYADGVLTVTIPVAETAKPRKVAVGTAAAIDTGEVSEAPAA